MAGYAFYTVSFHTQGQADRIMETIQEYNATGTSRLGRISHATIEQPRHEVLFFSQQCDTRMADATVKFFKARGISCDAEWRFLEATRNQSRA